MRAFILKGNSEKLFTYSNLNENERQVGDAEIITGRGSIIVLAGDGVPDLISWVSRHYQVEQATKKEREELSKVQGRLFGNLSMASIDDTLNKIR